MSVNQEVERLIEEAMTLNEEAKVSARILTNIALELRTERDAQSLLLDRIQYYVNMGMEDGSEACDWSHALGHVAQELREYAAHHLLGKYPPCVVQATEDQVLLRDGTKVKIGRTAGGARVLVVEEPNERVTG